MFEQSTLPSGPASKRLWATCLGVTGEALLVGFAMLAPMLWPQVLPRTMLITSLLPPVPRGHPKPDVERVPTTQAVVHRTPVIRNSAIYEPPRIPDKVVILVDPPTQVAWGPGVAGGINEGAPGAVNSTILDGILGSGSAPPAPRAVETHHPPVATAPPEVKRYKVGGIVKMAEVLHRVEPQYPPIAKQMRVQGVVELVGVIATDGHLKELRLVSGHPLLAHAAMEAVSRWIYKPTTLNGEPVEVIAPITVTFHLN
jgi:protein TonB